MMLREKCFGYVGWFKDVGSVTTTDHLVTATEVGAKAKDFFLSPLG